MEAVAKDQVTERPGLPAINFRVDDLVISNLNTKYGGIDVIKDVATYAFVMAGLREYRELRLTVDLRHKGLKKKALEYGRAVDTEKNRLKGLLAPGEDHLKSVRKVEDDRKTAIKAEKERVEQGRLKGIRNKISTIELLTVGVSSLSCDQIKTLLAEIDLLEITQEEYQEFTEEAGGVLIGIRNVIQTALDTRTKLDREALQRKAEVEHLAKIAKEQEAEAQRLAEVEARQIAAEAHLKAERQKIKDEKARLDTEKQAEIDRKEREKREAQIATEAKEQATQDANARTEREKAERIAKEKAEAEEVARQQALKPDKEKLVDYAARLFEVTQPELKDAKAREFLFHINADLTAITTQLRGWNGEVRE